MATGSRIERAATWARSEGLHRRISSIWSLSVCSFDEAYRAGLLAANLFLLLAAYYVLKTVREALILTEGGAEIKSYAAAVQAVLLLAILPAYGLAARKIG